MMKVLIKFKKVFWRFVVLVFILFIVCQRFYPEQAAKVTGYHLYVILTDSMEPTIPTYSVVLSKNYVKGEELSPNTIVSFRVNRFGDEVVFTHYFREKQPDDTGKMRYYTQGETADRYDDYHTYEEDILGTYVFHVPYVGKFILYLKSPFALIQLGIILFILVINKIIEGKIDEKEKAGPPSGPEEPEIRQRSVPMQ